MAAAPRLDAPPIAGIDATGRLYPIEKMQAHREGALHVAVSVFVICGDALLLQRRAAGKYHCAGLWANSCCTHPHWGETPASAAARRLYEELGVALPLRPGLILEYAADVTNGLREHERVHVFAADAADQNLALTLDSDEVEAVAWVALDDLQQRVRMQPERYAPWFRIYLERWDELGL